MKVKSVSGNTAGENFKTIQNLPGEQNDMGFSATQFFKHILASVFFLSGRVER